MSEHVSNQELPLADDIVTKTKLLISVAFKEQFGFDPTIETPKIESDSPHADYQLDELVLLFGNKADPENQIGLLAYCCSEVLNPYLLFGLVRVGDRGLEIDEAWSHRSFMRLHRITTNTEHERIIYEDDLGIRFRNIPLVSAEITHPDANLKATDLLLEKAIKCFYDSEKQIILKKQGNYSSRR